MLVNAPDGPQDRTDASQLDLILAWWKLIIGAVIAATVVAYLASSLLPPRYEATATLLVGELAGLEYDDVLAAQLQAENYAVLALSRATLHATATRFDVGRTVEQLEQNASSEAPLSTRFVTITVADGSPQLAADLANAVAATLLITGGDESQTESLVEVESDISTIRAEAIRITGDLNALSPGAAAGEGRALRDRLEELEAARLALLRQVSEMTELDLSFVNPAIAPDEPAAPRPLLNAAVAGIAAGVLGIAAALLLGPDRGRPPRGE